VTVPRSVNLQAFESRLKSAWRTLVILIAAALGFLGLGAQEPTPEWGAVVSNARKTFPGAWWNAPFPGLAIVTVFAFNVLRDGLRDLLDPRTQI
jgi:peptide/nickel transport system permease protein